MELMVIGLEMNLTVNVSDHVPYTSPFDISATLLAVVHCRPLNVSTRATGGLTLRVTAPAAFGASAVYSCSNSDYRLVGRPVRMCGADGVWTGEEPQCQC